MLCAGTAACAECGCRTMARHLRPYRSSRPRACAQISDPDTLTSHGITRGVQRVAAAGATGRVGPWVPRLAAFGAALVGLVNVASALTPSIRWRGHLLLALEPMQTIRLFHALALPAGTALLLVAPYLAK